MDIHRPQYFVTIPIKYYYFLFFSFTFIVPQKKKKPQPTQTTKKERKKERKMVSLNLQSLTMANLVYHLVYLTTQMQWPNFHCDM